MTTGNALLAAVEANPDDRDARAVYSDWLLENGELLGDIIASALNGELDRELTEEYELERFHHFDEGWKAEWDEATGFIRALEIETEAGGDFLRALAEEPALRILQKLDLGVYIDEDEEGAGPTNPFAALATAPFPRTLRELRFWMDRGDPDDEEASRDYTELWPHIPFVEHLMLESPLSLRALSLPNLRRLRLNAPRGRKALDDLASADLPALETLDIQDDHWRYDGFDVPFPKLERFGYFCLPPTGDSNARGLFRRLASSPLVRRVRVLDLSIAVDAENAPILAEHAASLLHLRELHVGATCDELTRALGSRVKVAKE